LRSEERRKLEILVTSEDFERGNVGHGRGVVATNDCSGNFTERPMSAGELAARTPAWKIGADQFPRSAAAFTYIRCWEIIAPAIDAALAAQAVEHNRRVTELLEANNREVERRQAAEAEIRRLSDKPLEPKPLPRGGGTLKAICEFLPTRPEWSTPEIRERLAAQGIVCTKKQTANAIAYLVWRKRIIRLGYGRYTAASAIDAGV
jgi:hypothetical protein